MATTKLFAIKTTEVKALAYIANPEKTDNGRLVYAFGCSEKPSRAARDFAEIRSRRSTVLAQHFIVSFKLGEITPENNLRKPFILGRLFFIDILKFKLAYAIIGI